MRGAALKLAAQGSARSAGEMIPQIMSGKPLNPGIFLTRKSGMRVRSPYGFARFAVGHSAVAIPDFCFKVRSGNHRIGAVYAS